ncbi:hypothetical protein R4P64_03355 [Rhodococcus sp. IEGM 1366]|uniref:hypothetical protein n=1 Tax=Rhodococcus sp. IEGM 1366 TaxID=3082223 RepID=UPI0029539407|nr:hypothetical protein [Rhodococcus sp. IEGM 1366]MDV8065535.1 hypothetical protein [Rhodococcus sp. IEGM 1366]
MNDHTAGEVTQESMEKASANAVIAELRRELEVTFPVTQSDVREWFDVLETMHGASHKFDENRCEYTTDRLNYFADAERRVSEFFSAVYMYSEENRIPDGFDFEYSPGLFVRYEPMREWPSIREADGFRPVEVSTSEKIFSDGTSSRVVSIEAGNAELTYESVHLLIDYLTEAARSLVADDAPEGDS